MTDLRTIGKDDDWLTREKIAKIIDRYTYEGPLEFKRVQHMECHYGRNGMFICTCGLINDLMRLSAPLAEELYPDYIDEMCRHQGSFNLMPPA